MTKPFVAPIFALATAAVAAVGLTPNAAHAGNFQCTTEGANDRKFKRSNPAQLEDTMMDVADAYKRYVSGAIPDAYKSGKIVDENNDGRIKHGCYHNGETLYEDFVTVGEPKPPENNETQTALKGCKGLVPFGIDEYGTDAGDKAAVEACLEEATPGSKFVVVAAADMVNEGALFEGRPYNEVLTDRRAAQVASLIREKGHPVEIHSCGASLAERAGEVVGQASGEQRYALFGEKEGNNFIAYDGKDCAVVDLSNLKFQSEFHRDLDPGVSGLHLRR